MEQESTGTRPADDAGNSVNASAAASGATNAGGEAEEISTPIAEEAVLNAAVAFAGHVATAAQQAVDQLAASAPPRVREAVVRQYFLETATLCLRRLGDSYSAATASDDEEGSLLRDGAARAQEASAAVEVLGDLSLDLLDRLLEE